MRLHLFEFNDQPWLPSIVRNALTAYLYVAYRSTPFGAMFSKRIATLLTLNGSNRIVDLCSGSGGPIAIVHEELIRQGVTPEITMTDLFPNPSVKNGSIDYWPQSVDARHVPHQLTGMRTMFAAFHHFQRQDAVLILQNAFEERCPIAIFEVTARTPAGLVAIILNPFGVLLMTPKIRPVTWFQIVFTYLIPILPLMIFWDGFVSQLRTYSSAEMKEMTLDISAPGYEWDCGTMKVPGTPLAVPYLTGMPIN